MEKSNIVEKYEIAQNCKDLFTIQAIRNQKNGGKGLTISSSSKVNVRKKMAAFCGVSEDSYRKLDKVMNSGNTVLIEKLRNGEMKINQAYNALSDKIIVEKSLNTIGLTEYTFYFVSERGEKKELLSTSVLFLLDEWLERVPLHLKLEFLRIFNECKEESYAQYKTDETAYSDFKSFRSINEDNNYKQTWKKFYRELVKLYHPDNDGNDKKMQELTRFNTYMEQIL